MLKIGRILIDTKEALARVDGELIASDTDTKSLINGLLRDYEPALSRREIRGLSALLRSEECSG